MEESEEDSDLLRMQVRFRTLARISEGLRLQFQAQMVEREYEILQDLNFTLEVEHCDSLQDMEALEGQLKKYQYLFNIKEVSADACFVHAWLFCSSKRPKRKSTMCVFKNDRI